MNIFSIKKMGELPEKACTFPYGGGHRIMELLKLEKTSKIMMSHCQSITTMSTNICPKMLPFDVRNRDTRGAHQDPQAPVSTGPNSK